MDIMLKKLVDLLYGTAVPEDPQRRVQRAACVLLLEAAHADNLLMENELAEVNRAVMERFGLSEQEALDLIEESEAVRESSNDLWQFARTINESLSVAEKIGLLEDVWRVIYADGRLQNHEDYLAHKLIDLLRLNHQQFINAKLKILAESNAT
jgi:uncharacterized tellurite resistance protein B-like protein